jgi:hypothetical protein
MATNSNPVYRKIGDAGRITCRPPKGLERSDDIFSSFRTVQLPEAFVLSVRGGYIAGDGYAYEAVMTSDRESLSDLTFGEIGEDSLPAPTCIPGRIGVLTARSGSTNPYFHWMCGVLPRIQLLRGSGLRIDKYAIRERHSPFQYETLRALGLDDGSLVEVGTRFHIKAEELAVPSVVPVMVPAWVCAFLRERFLGAAANHADERLYISRRASGRGRQVTNERQIKELLAEFGFREFLPHQTSVAEQASAFASADFIVGAHGSALTNLVFCRPGTKVIEMFAPTYVHPVYWMLSSQCNLDYYYSVGTGERPPTWSAWPSGSVGCPIEVDLEQLHELLKMAGL